MTHHVLGCRQYPIVPAAALSEPFTAVWITDLTLELANPAAVEMKRLLPDGRHAIATHGQTHLIIALRHLKPA